MKYFKFRYIIFSLLIISSAYIIKLSGCQSEDGIIDTNIPLNREAIFAKIASDYYTTLSKGLTLLIMRSNNIGILINGCPTITDNGNLSEGTLTFDYGTIPCISSYEVTRRSGKIFFDYMIDTSNTDSIYTIIRYENYRIYKGTFSSDTTSSYFSGNDTLRITRMSNIIYIVSGKIDKQIVSSELNYRLKLKDTSIININNVNDMFDDYFTITSNGAFIDVKNAINYDFSTGSPENLLITGNCIFPFSGIIKYNTEGKLIKADFFPENNSCDNNVLIMSGSNSRLFNLNLINY